ncbi:hypothetical protein BDF19DRAFT_20037 [Syncephalis fuscata]|nr:hypothetical protein BDF19DRAFT_20037 [Syncephalis fuscata]
MYPRSMPDGQLFSSMDRSASGFSNPSDTFCKPSSRDTKSGEQYSSIGAMTASTPALLALTGSNNNSSTNGTTVNGININHSVKLMGDQHHSHNNDSNSDHSNSNATDPDDASNNNDHHLAIVTSANHNDRSFEETNSIRIEKSLPMGKRAHKRTTSGTQRIDSEAILENDLPSDASHSSSTPNTPRDDNKSDEEMNTAASPATASSVSVQGSEASQATPLDEHRAAVEIAAATPGSRTPNGRGRGRGRGRPRQNGARSSPSTRGRGRQPKRRRLEQTVATANLDQDRGNNDDGHDDNNNNDNDGDDDDDNHTHQGINSKMLFNVLIHSVII